MNGGVALCVEVDRSRIEKRLQTRYLDEWTDDLDTALAWCASTPTPRRPGASAAGQRGGDPARILATGHQPDLVTTRPAPTTSSTATSRRPEPGRRGGDAQQRAEAYASGPAVHAHHVEACWSSSGGGRDLRLRQQPPRAGQRAGCANAFDFLASCPPSSGRYSAGHRPFRWVALSGDRRTSMSPTRP